MKKIYYKLNDVDCANCGVKIQDEVNRIEGVYFSSYIFMTQRLSVLYDETIIDEQTIENTIVNTIDGVKIFNKKNVEVNADDIKLTNKKNDKVKMILFRRRK